MLRVVNKRKQENILMALRGEGLVDGDLAASAAATVYVLHPNCALEEF